MSSAARDASSVFTRAGIAVALVASLIEVFQDARSTLDIVNHARDAQWWK